jgi:hypothetical protein
MRDMVRSQTSITGRKTLKRWCYVVGSLWAWLLICGLFLTVHAQEIVPTVTPVATFEGDAETDTLTKIILSRQALQEELSAKNDELKRADTEDQQAVIRKKIQELTSRIQDLDGDFESIATGIDVAQFSTTPTEAFDWQQELQDLLRRPAHANLKNSEIRCCFTKSVLPSPKMRSGIFRTILTLPQSMS